jgi:hypothetical protein
VVPLSQVNANVSDERLWSLRRDGFSAVYADIGEYLRRFVARASSLAVHAVAGGPNWTTESHRYLGPKVLELVADHNADAEPDERLKGVQFDIEHVRREFDYASASGAACGIVIGQEFTEVTPTKLSLWWAGPPAGRRPQSSPGPTAGFRGSAASRSTTWTPTRRSGGGPEALG